MDTKHPCCNVSWKHISNEQEASSRGTHVDVEGGAVDEARAKETANQDDITPFRVDFGI
jgi:hypothetical protein